MGRRCTYPFIFSPLKFRNRKDCNSFPPNLTENATLLGIVDVPSRHGNEICFYASLLIKKLNEAQSRKAELVKLIVDEDCIITKDKNNNIQLKYHFEDLTYVWVHPDESRTLGIICTFKTLNSPNPISTFTAFRMPSKMMDDVRIPEAPERKCADPARMEICRALLILWELTIQNCLRNAATHQWRAYISMEFHTRFHHKISESHKFGWG
ncbi:hypothetical protein ACTXT7_015092, partial [Hymenolepis weldensis]